MRLDLREKIIVEMKRRKMTQKQLADSINIKRERLNEVLNNKRNSIEIIDLAYSFLFKEN